ncbi:MAG TPA: phospholipase D-like domain-containing protein [Candidatus Angelobacter sp.]|nr:phospholipase D-like domain-containing protein [Candidatus Angelobacter sp.]
MPAELRRENVVRLGEALTGGVRGPEFEALVHRIDTGPLHKGNEVAIFFDGDKAFASVAKAIEAATREILLETYILKDDAVGYTLIEWLARAVARGVQVRLLADAFGSGRTSRSFWRQLEQTGIQARLFHPLWVHLRDHLIRDHRKIIVVDGRVSFTGGMNVGNEYGSSRHAKGGLWRDTHARIEGSTAWELALVFKEGWMRSGGDSFPIHPFEPHRDDGVKTLVLDSRPGRGDAETAAVLAAIIGASRRYLWITNSYFAPRRNAIKLLGGAARRGVDVRLLLPGISDVPIVRHAGHGCFAELLGSGVRIFEYQPAILHAKTLVADDYISLVGSSNLDFRSFHFNAECNVVMLDEETARRMAEAFECDLAQSVEIGIHQWKNRPLLHQLGDSFAQCLSPLL